MNKLAERRRKIPKNQFFAFRFIFWTDSDFLSASTENQKILKIFEDWEITICFIQVGKRILFERKEPTHQQTVFLVQKNTAACGRRWESVNGYFNRLERSWLMAEIGPASSGLHYRGFIRFM